jgi:hypothetical protein
MPVACLCGSSRVLSSNADERRCIKCGAACCSACAYSLESATYCSACAQSILDGEGVPLGLSPVAPEAWPPPATVRPRPHTPVRGSDSAQWLILVAKDQPDLYGHLVRAFSRDDKVQILLDRRRDYSRNPPGMEERLRIHGAAVIRRRSP